jgi:hypothetical protein
MYVEVTLSCRICALVGRICHLQTAGHFGKAELQRNIDCESMLQFERGEEEEEDEEEV